MSADNRTQAESAAAAIRIWVPWRCPAAKQGADACASAFCWGIVKRYTKPKGELDLGVLYGHPRSRPEGMIRHPLNGLLSGHFFHSGQRADTWSREASDPCC